MNNATNIVLGKIDYKDIVTTEIDEENNKVLKTDVTIINKIASNIALEIQKELNELEKQNIKIPLGALSGNKYLAGVGPNINIQVITAKNILTEIKNEFESKGINQTIYRIYLELSCNVSIVTQHKTIEDKITNQILLVETVIVL